MGQRVLIAVVLERFSRIPLSPDNLALLPKPTLRGLVNAVNARREPVRGNQGAPKSLIKYGSQVVVTATVVQN
jgi:hypothetical protein